MVFSWQEKQISVFGRDNCKVVMSPWVWARWQMVHGTTMAEWTDLPRVLST